MSPRGLWEWGFSSCFSKVRLCPRDTTFIYTLLHTLPWQLQGNARLQPTYFLSLLFSSMPFPLWGPHLRDVMATVSSNHIRSNKTLKLRSLLLNLDILKVARPDSLFYKLFNVIWCWLYIMLKNEKKCSLSVWGLIKSGTERHLFEKG